jgi:DNA-binding NarL/FixJ family response regulator
MTNSEIAAALSFAEITIKNDVQRIIAKLDAAEPHARRDHRPEAGPARLTLPARRCRVRCAG